MTCPTCTSEVPATFKFCGNCGQPLDAAPAPARPAAAGPAPAPLAAPAGERREVAVLFGDVSGFTKMSERLDPEEVHSIMNECFAGLGARPPWPMLILPRRPGRNGGRSPRAPPSGPRARPGSVGRRRGPPPNGTAGR
ncbi:MAG: hypothetical protein HY002_08940 [Candidatus Rokubacteria bacterium]|nr:hypothetical protein [Candidatus Rokubacteria bacterium]